jgi:hypothetical protein
VAAAYSALHAVEPIRRWAYLLPLPARLRLDGLAFCIGHGFWRDTASEQLRRDLGDLLNGRELGPMLEPAFALIFPSLLATVLLVDRYQQDPLTRGLGEEFYAIHFGEKLSKDGIDIRREECGSPEARLLLDNVMGSSRRSVDPRPRHM